MANANTVGTLDLIWSGGFLLGLVYVIRGIIRARRRTSRAAGTVVRVAIRGSSVIAPSPDVEFVDGQGNKHLCKSGYSTSWNQWPVGSQVEVTYDPHDPTNCELVMPRVMVMMLVLVGSSFALLAARILYDALQFLYDALQSMWG